MTPATVHPTAEVDPTARLGSGTRVWHYAQVREGAVIGDECILGKSAYVDKHVRVGNRVKIQNNASVFSGSSLEDGVFVGPHACLTNDRWPRSIGPDGAVKGAEDWEAGTIVVQTGASIGAGAIVVTGVRIGCWALVGAGAVVVRDVPDHGLVVGNPARQIGFVCTCAHRLIDQPAETMRCSHCGALYRRDPSGRLQLVEADRAKQR